MALMLFSCDHIITVINLNLRVMWYNRVVSDEDNNILFKERIFIDEDKVWEVYGGLGMDIMGNYIIEWWD